MSSLFKSLTQKQVEEGGGLLEGERNNDANVYGATTRETSISISLSVRCAPLNSRSIQIISVMTVFLALLLILILFLLKMHDKAILLNEESGGGQLSTF